MDANINLLNLDLPDSSNYLNLLFSAGFIQGIFNASRLQNLSKSLIDHIHLNTFSNKVCTGVIVRDISDHFFTFICRQSGSPKNAKHLSYIHLGSSVCLSSCHIPSCRPVIFLSYLRNAELFFMF
jgi:hypothetical protein